MRRAFTVVELLVVIAIIGVLMALLLPAVQAAREAARKTKCAANLKQIAMGALAHNTTFEYFPNAGGPDGAARSVNSSGIPQNALRQDWGVFYQILPYIEQKATYDLTSNSQVAALTLPLYFCPTRRKPTAVSGSMANGLAATDMRGGVDYAGSGGSGGTDPMGKLVPYTSLSYQNGVIIPRPGIQAGQVSEKITGASISDGQSNVLMFGERQYNRNPPGPQSDEDNGYFNGWSADTIRWSAVDKPAPDRVQSSFNFDTRFGGPHTGVVMVALCDGSTRPLKYASVDGVTFRQLTNRSDRKSPQLQ